MILQIVWWCFLTAICYQVCVYLYLGSKLAAYQHHGEHIYAPKNRAMPAPVSVIICAHNELHNLKALLPLLYRQRYKNFEIIVVDDCSDDGTLDFLNHEKKQQPLLKVVWIKQRPKHVQSKKYAITLGVKAARYDKLLLTDADCRPGSDLWVTGIAAELREKKIFVLGYSPYYVGKGLLNYFIRYETLHTGFLYISSAIAGFPYMGVGRNMAYKKSFFMEKKGFCRIQQLVGGDDDLFVNRHATSTNTAINIHPNTLMYSFPKQTWQTFYRQKVRHLGVGKYYKKKDQYWLGLLSFSSIVLWTCFLMLIMDESERYWSIASFLVRWGLLFAVIKIAGKKLNDPVNLAILPILDVLHVFYYIVIGTKALSTKNTRWN